MSSDPVIVALQDQVNCYRRLAKLAELQHEHVQQGQTDELLEVLSRRQAVLDELADLEQLVAPARRRWSEYVLSLPAALRGQAEDLLTSTRELLEQITAADRNDALVLQQRKLNLGRQIGQASSARQVNRAYTASAYARPLTGLNVAS